MTSLVKKEKGQLSLLLPRGERPRRGQASYRSSGLSRHRRKTIRAQL